MAGAKRSTYEVSDAMLNRFVKWSKTPEFSDAGVYNRITAVVKWLRNEGFSGSRPMFSLLRELQRLASEGNTDRWNYWLVDRITDCIERQYEKHYEVAEAARTLLRSMTDEIDSIAKGGE